MTAAKKSILRRAVSVAAGLIAAAPMCLTGSAAQQLKGDVNCDGTVTRADPDALLGHLTGAAALKAADASENADLNGDGVLDAADLTAVKRLILNGSVQGGSSGQVSSDPETGLIRSPLHALNPGMGSVGTQRVLLIAVSFPDCERRDGLTAEQIRARCFGDADAGSSAFPMESIRAYYQRASYGRLTLEGDVYTCTVANELSIYQNKPDKLVDEVMTALDKEIDFRTYDADGDGMMNPVIVALPNAAGNTDWGPACGKFSLEKTYDGVTPAKRCVGCAPLENQAEFNRIWIHELGHTMGLPDYYKFANTQKGKYGLNGDAGWEMLDDANGDLSGFSKLMYGWLSEKEMQVYTGGTQTFRLESAQVSPGCIVIPHGDLNGFLSEFFVIEYATNAGNNQSGFANRQVKKLFTEGGLRVLHCDAEVYESFRGTEFKWYNYSKYYDSSNEKQRVLRLANEAEGGSFFTAGDIIDNRISGFRWYDENGDQTVDTGFSISVDCIADGVCTVTIREQAG